MSPRFRHHGYTLLAVLIVLTIASLLVAGAIAFTGTERSAAVLRTRDERLSACTQAARNLFLSQTRVLQGKVSSVSLDASLPYGDAGDTVQLQSRHYSMPDGGSTTLTSVQRLNDNTMAGASTQVSDSSNRVGKPMLMAGYYWVTAVCEEGTSGPEREIEFVVRVGI